MVIDFHPHPGQEPEWILNHVRAGQEVVEKEIAAAGFKKAGEVKDLLKENYFVVFKKPAARAEVTAGGDELAIAASVTAVPPPVRSVGLAFTLPGAQLAPAAGSSAEPHAGQDEQPQGQEPGRHQQQNPVVA